MRKFICLFLMIAGFSLFAEENVLFKSDVSADLNGYDYVSNFEIKSNSGYFNKNQLVIKYPNEKGIRFIAYNPPEDISASYEIEPAYPSFLNEMNVGAGNIYNASTIKSIKIVATTNRPYDEIILLYSTSPNGIVHEIKMPQNFNEIKSMEEFTLVYNNPLYEEDVNKRNLKKKPVVGADADGIYFRGIKIKTNAPTGYNSYSPYSILFLKEISIVYDKAFTDEQLKLKNEINSEFEIDENKNIKDKAIAKINEKNTLKAEQEALKHKDNIGEEK